MAHRVLTGGPEAVRPTLDAIAALGLQCGSGIPDNVPSGLFQWHCHGSIESTTDVIILVGGNEAGVSALDISTPTDDFASARAVLGPVAARVPPLSGLDGLPAALHEAFRSLSGRQTSIELLGLRVSAWCIPPSEFGDGRCTISFVGPDPLRPMLS